MFRSVRFSLVAALGIVAASQSVFAASHVDGVEVGRVTVSYSDLDLNTAAGARLMLTRLQVAAYRACGGDPRLNPNYDLMGPGIERAYRECRGNAVSRAVTTVDAPLLTEVHSNTSTPRFVRASAD